LLTEPVQQKLTQEASVALGVSVSVVKIRLLVWPPMAVELSDVELHTEPSLTLQRVRLSPAWVAVLQGRLALSSLHVQGVELSQSGLLTLHRLQKKKQDTSIARGVEPENMQAPVELPGVLTFEQVTWTAVGGACTTVRGHLVLNDQGWVDDGVVEVLKGSFSGSRARLSRRGDNWLSDVAAGSGTVGVTMLLRQIADPVPTWVLTGRLATRGVSMTQLTLSPTLSGQLVADTTLSAQAASLGTLLDVLKTQNTFTEPRLSLTRSALLGAVVGTAVMPGVGTGIRKFFGQ
jgi:hypothetical protein